MKKKPPLKSPTETVRYVKVLCNLWAAERYYINKQGRQIKIHLYEEAREYARKQGYAGIRVQYV